MNPIISLELNELCPDLLDKWMADGLLPNFRKLHDMSQVFLTMADTEEPKELEPWIQWYSIHTGKPYSSHKVFHLTDGREAEHDDIWRLCMDNGHNVMNFASMNARPFARDGSLFVADPWCENENAYPAELNIYNRFVAHNVREYSNAENKLDWKDYAEFLRFLIMHGFTANTAINIIRQLAGERIKPKSNYRRVAILDALQFDVFAHYYRRYKPVFASFFVNSVAHLQHGFWRYMQPDAFDMRPDHAGLQDYGNAIQDGYVAMDSLVGKMLKLAKRHNAIVVMQTALSQQPFTRYDDKGAQHFQRIRDIDTFLQDFGIATVSADPVMTHQYMLSFANSADRDTAKSRLEAFTLEDGEKLFGFSSENKDHALYFGCQVSRAIDPQTKVRENMTGNSFALSKYFYEIDATKSGCHHPQGALWIGSGAHKTHSEPVSILDIYPSFADMLNIDIDKKVLDGKSLINWVHHEKPEKSTVNQ